MSAPRIERSPWTSMLAVAVCLSCRSAAGGVAVTRVEVDGQANTPPSDAALFSGGQNPLRISSRARSIRFHVANLDGGSPSAVRLRYKLEGHDDAWHDLPATMRVMVHFCDSHRDVVGSNEFYLAGETAGWRGTAEGSEFVSRREQATAPERSATARIACLSHGVEPIVGLLGIDAMRVRIERPGGRPAEVFGLSVTKGTDLGHRLGSPVNWMREGSRAELAQLRPRLTPDRHTILVLEDDDARHFGNWATVPAHSIPVRPGDRLTVEWQMAHSIGSAGPGLAEYQQLKPGSYWFRVAAVKANGDPTGVEVSLPIAVLVPWYLRVEFYLVIAALILGTAAWVGRWALKRRMQRRIAEIEQEQALDHERARIARDLHDEIGAALTEIAMQSDWVRRDLAQGATPDNQRRIESVCHSSVDLVRSVDEIVWAVNPANDTVERFVNYLAQYTEQFLEAAGLHVRFDIPSMLPVTPLSGTLRHGLFLSVREALNNVVRHAGADLVRLEIRTGKELRILVEDTGCGFAVDQRGAEGTQEGLENMRRRMEEIGGRFQLTSQRGRGTRVEFVVASAE